MINKGSLNQQGYQPVADADSEFASEGYFQNQDTVALLKEYLNENVPKAVRDSDVYKDFWAVMGKTPQLSFLDADEFDELISKFHQAKYYEIMSLPKGKKSFKILQQLKQFEMYFRLALKRSQGSKENRFNERIILASQMQQSISSRSENISTGQPRRNVNVFGAINQFLGGN